MTIETILVPLSVTSSNEALLDTGIAVARRFNAHLEVLHIRRLARDAVPFVLDLGSRLKDTVIEAEERKAEEEAAHVRAQSNPGDRRANHFQRSDCGLVRGDE